MGNAKGATRRKAAIIAAKKQLLQLNFYINTGRQIEFHQSVNSFVGWIDDIHQAEMGTNLELVARGLVDVRRTQNVETLDAGRQGHRALDDGAGALGGLNDFSGRLVDQAIVESLQADTDLLVLLHDVSLKSVAAEPPGN